MVFAVTSADRVGSTGILYFSGHIFARLNDRLVMQSIAVTSQGDNHDQVITRSGNNSVAFAGPVASQCPTLAAKARALKLQR
jgi:hypothetical protein